LLEFILILSESQMKLKHLTTTPFQTKKLGEILAKKFLKTKLKKTALVIGLEGNLGGGKTTFLQGFAKGLGIKKRILSPTFIIVKRFQVSGFRFQYFYHIDCYRIQKLKEILDLGFKKIISNPQNIVAIEWADRIRKILPRETFWISFEFTTTKSIYRTKSNINQNTRKITINSKLKV